MIPFLETNVAIVAFIVGIKKIVFIAFLIIRAGKAIIPYHETNFFLKFLLLADFQAINLQLNFVEP